MESLRTDAHQGWGTSNSAQLSVGGLLQLTNHPNASLNTLWQISRIVYRGSQPQALEQEGGDKATTLENEFEFIPRHQSWRPMQLTKPRVEGPQIAIVVVQKMKRFTVINLVESSCNFYGIEKANTMTTVLAGYE